jgi:hypothetical protein
LLYLDRTMESNQSSTQICENRGVYNDDTIIRHGTDIECKLVVFPLTIDLTR